MADASTQVQQRPRLTREQAVAFFAELFYGEQHIPGEITSKNEYHWTLTTWPYNWEIGSYDYDLMTRMAFLAHDSCIRAQILPEKGGRVRIVLDARNRPVDGDDMTDRHPTIEVALAKWREKHPASDESPAVLVPKEQLEALRTDLATRTAERDSAAEQLQSLMSDQAEDSDASQRYCKQQREERDAALERAEQWRVQSEKDAAAAGEARSQLAQAQRANAASLLGAMRCLRHMLGVGVEVPVGNWGHRNHYNAEPGHHSYPHLVTLRTLGLAIEDRPGHWSATIEGAWMAGLTASQVEALGLAQEAATHG